MMKKWLYEWSFSKVLRLTVGAMFVYQAYAMKDYVLAIAGIFFIVTGFMNMGCCGINQCNIQPQQRAVENKEVSFEEIK